MTTTYDEVLYLGAPFSQTHPERLGMLAQIHGMRPAPVDHCRVLELGCTDGGNLIPMALALPQSSFLGVDLSRRAIATGRQVIQDLKLTNIELRAADIMDVDASWGEFDFIITHGVFSWVPAPVREQILRISKRNLAPQGVAYISYNAQPGGHLRTMVRDMMLFHVRGIEEPGKRIARAREIVAFLAENTPDRADDYRGFLRKELEGILERSPNILFHDELSEAWHPVFFHEFISQAEAHGLRYLSEANHFDTQEKTFGDDAAATIEKWSGSREEREQYRDFLKCRRFRQTLLCHHEVALQEEPSSTAAQTLFITSPARFISEENGVKSFEGLRSSSMKTSHPIALAIIERLIAAWPLPLHFDELLESVGPQHKTAQSEIVLALFSAGLVQLHSWRPSIATTAGEFPVASPLARLQAAAGATLTTLRHTHVETGGALERALITLLDGAHNRAALERELRPHRPKTSRKAFREELENNLTKAAYLALLTD